MCVPHHSKGILFDGHQEFEKWAGIHWQEFATEEQGLYLDYTHPSQWIDYNAQTSASFYPKVSSQALSNPRTYAEAAGVLIPLTIQSTAGFLNFVRNELVGVTLRLK
jgi:phospholipase C